MTYIPPGAPAAHAASHKSGGADAVKLDELAAPTDVTTLDVSATAHGLTPKFPNNTTTFLRGDGTYAAPPAGGSPPTGTGFRHVTAGAEDAASKLVESADVHSNLKDPAAGTAGLRTIGTGALTALAGNTTFPGRIRSVTVYTVGGPYTHTPAAGTTALRVRGCGGGAGGGGSDGNGSAGGHAQGGSGAGSCFKFIATAPVLTITVGAKGTGGPGGAAGLAGTAGADTTVTGTGISLTMKGGAFGSGVVAGTGVLGSVPVAPTAGTTGGDFNIEGQRGGGGQRFTGTNVDSGDGGDSVLGHGGRAGRVTNPGTAATGYGAGGGGGSTSGAGADQAGGDGTDGLVIVEEYY